MKVFITGIAGFLGSHLADRFLQEGAEVSGCDNLIGGYLDNVPTGAVFYNVDLLNLEALKKIVLGADIVYHTACTAYEGLSVFSPALVCQNTYQISINAMSAAISAGVKRFIHCSSMARYGAHEEIPFRETMPCRPQDPYGISKYAAELCLRNLAETHGIELVIAVPHNIIGPRQKYDDPYRNVASIMINLMLQRRQPIIYGDGRQLRCFSDVADCVDILYRFAFADNAKGEIFNIGPDQNPVTILELAEIIANKIGHNLDPIFLPPRPNEVRFATCSADKIREYFGYETKVTLSESLDAMIAYIDSRGPKPFEYHLPLEIVNERTPRTWTERLF